MAETGPYAQTAKAYADQGWTVIPVRANSKRVAINGYTGADGVYPEVPKMMKWREQYGGCNIAIRMPQDVIGIDVDQYGEKPGYETLRALEAEYGELPPTAVVTSRKDGKSGIRLFRVRSGQHWKGIAGPGIETLTWYHRYAVVAPSIHPDTEAEYRWYWENDDYNLRPMRAVPRPQDVPDLPQAWQDFLFTSAPASKRGKLEAGAIRSWLAEMGSGAPCKAMQEVTGLWIDRLTDSEDDGGSHEAMLGGVKAVIGDAMAGHPGMEKELTRLRMAFLSATGERRDEAAANSEWRRAVFGAVRLHLGDSRTTCDPCADANLSGGGLGPVRANGQRVTAESMREGRKAGLDKAFERRVDEAYTSLRAQQEARRRLVSEHAVPVPDELVTLDVWLQRDVEPVRPLVPGLMALDGATMLVAQAKAGKTTLGHNLIRSAADGDPFLEAFQINPVPDGKRMVLLDFEMSEGMLYDWIDDQDIQNKENVVIESLDGKASSFNILDPFCLLDWASKLRAALAGYIIIDCLAPALAAIGVDENSNAEVGQWLNAARMLQEHSGAFGLLILHHTGRVGEHARGASRLEGWTSDNLRLTLAGNGEDDDGKFTRANRFLSARGRLASEFDEVMVESYGKNGRLLRVGGGSKAEMAAERVQPAVIEYLKLNPGCTIGSVERAVQGDTNAIRNLVRTFLADGSACNHGKLGKGFQAAIFWDCKGGKECPKTTKFKV